MVTFAVDNHCSCASPVQACAGLSAAMNHYDRQIFQLALPAIVSNVTVPLLGLVDVAIVGHIGNAVYISAIAIGSMIFNVIYWVFGFLRMGTSGLTAQARGRRDLREAVGVLCRSLSVGLLIALLILLLQHPLRLLAYFLIQPPAEALPLVDTYYRIAVWGAPAMLSLYGLSGWYIGMQNTRIPMFVSIFQNVVNIVASLLLVFGAGMDVAGVALGTVIAQYVGLAVGLLLLSVHYGKLRKHLAVRGQLRGRSMWEFFRVNRDIFVRTLCLVAVNLFFLSAGASQGALVLAVNTLLMQLFMLFSYVMDGFGFAGEALAGKYWGAGDAQAYRTTVARLFRWGAVVMLLFTLCYALGGTSFVGLLTSDGEVLAASRPYMIWAMLIPVAGMAAFVWDGVYIGVTETRGMLLAMLLAAVLFFGLYFLLKTKMANHALWLAFIVFLSVRGLIQTLRRPRL